MFKCVYKKQNNVNCRNIVICKAKQNCDLIDLQIDLFQAVEYSIADGEERILVNTIVKVSDSVQRSFTMLTGQLLSFSQT